MLEAGIDYAVIEKLLGPRLHGMGEGYNCKSVSGAFQKVCFK